MISLNPSSAAALKIGVTGIVAGVFYLQPYRPMVVVGRSMEPTYENHSIQLTEPVSKSELRKGDVVVINMSTGPIVKRIAFMPGDKIPQVEVEGKWVDMISVHPLIHSRLSWLPTRYKIVPPDMAYVLGDNQEISYDSKNFGYVPQDEIVRILADQKPLPVTKKAN